MFLRRTTIAVLALCAAASAAAAGCTSSGAVDEIGVGPTTAAADRAVQPLSFDCDPSAISRDMGQQLAVVRCHGDWAYVSSGELGDAQSLLRVSGGEWTRYTGFPSSTCRAEAQADGVPAAELASFRPC